MRLPTFGRRATGRDNSRPKEREMARKRYSKQFKDEACKLVIDHGYTWEQAAGKLGIPQSTFDYWMQQRGRLLDGQVIPGDSEDPKVLKARVRQLERQLRQAQMEKDILKKATVYFAGLKP